MVRKQADKKRRLLGVTSRLMMTIAAGMLVLSYASVVVNPAKVWLISLLGLLFVPLSFLNLILLLWALKRRSKSFLIPLLALLPSLIFLGRYVRPGGDPVAAPQDPTLKIVSYNVGRFASFGSGDNHVERNVCADSVFSFIRQQDADIICVQEFHVHDMDRIKAYVRRNLKGYKAEYYMFPLHDGSAFGNITFSRIPVSGKGKIKFEESANLALYTDYETNGRRFRVYNCHFESYNISFTGIVKAMFNENRATVFAETGTKMKRSVTRRPEQVDQVFSDIEKCPIEAFVCGDFNDNPMSYSYYRLIRGRKDAFVEAGHGFGATFSRLWPMLRIDYILLPERFRTISHETVHVPFSDHYPVVAEVEL